MSTTPPTGTHGGPTTDDREVSEVVASLLVNGQGLVKTELELAKLELQRIAKEKATAIGLTVAGALLGLYILAFAGVTAAQALMLVLAPWLAWLLVTLAYLLVAVILVLVAVRLFKRPSTPERTKAELELTRTWASEQVQR
ncbi:MAG: phage holin family protein [Nitriliruptoraceae bacterium]